MRIEDYLLNAPDEEGTMFLVVRSRTNPMAIVPLQLQGGEDLEVMLGNFVRAITALDCHPETASGPLSINAVN
jgi:hypothetical protein